MIKSQYYIALALFVTLVITNIVFLFIPTPTPPIEQLFAVANTKLQNLVANNEWTHSIGDCDFSCRADKLQLDFSKEYSENLYDGICDLDTAITLWKESPEHARNLEKSYDYFIIVGERYAEDRCYFVYNILKNTE